MADNIRRRQRTKSGQAGPPSDDKKKPRYNLRSKTTEETVRWVDDDTLFDDVSDSDDSTYTASTSSNSEKEETTTRVHGISVPSNLPVSVKIHLHARVDDEEEEEEEESDDDDDSGESFIGEILRRSLGNHGPIITILGDDDDDDVRDKRKKNSSELPIKLFSRERSYFESLTRKKKKETVEKMKKISGIIGETEVPLKFKTLELTTSPQIQSEIIRKIDMINRMGSDSSEAQKLRNWVDGALRIPFGKVVPMPVTIADGREKCSEFLDAAQKDLDRATYGMLPAKLQIMQTLAQWVSNPDSIGNCIAMKGPPGVGKTAFARNGIAKVLNRPFVFFSLGGATDIAHYTGHSYTYEGSMWGRIIDSIIQSGCMNPVLYFDELDKISETPHGQEITSMLIHLTDRSQNCHFHDRYFAGIDFDLSQCLFVFSYNDETKVHPVLKDRLTTIQCSGYKEDEKKIIVANYVWPEILKNTGIKREELTATEEAAEYIIKEYSNGEEGMRNLIRIVEAVVSRINLIRISNEENAKKYRFYVPIEFPMKLTVDVVKKVLTDVSPKIPEEWRSMYL
ncbi:MAG: AAA family ATPase [Actinobacteria bacterium]|nr:AAA family ATPase [Actinomycetota bacterium]